MYDNLKLFESRPKYQRLVIEFEKGEDPDDAYSTIPYEKGANFLLYLGERSLVDKFLEVVHNCCAERLLGGLKIFLLYAHDYVTTFSGKSIDTWEWKDHLYSYFRKNGGDEKLKLLDTVDWDVSH